MKKLKRSLSLLLVLVMVFSSVIPTEAASIKLNKTKTTVYVGKSVNLKVSGTSKKVTWTTSSKKIATVSSSGKVTGRKVGSATITAKVGSKKLKCKVTVKANLNTTKLTLAKNGTYTLKLQGASAKSFKSSNAKVVSVSKKGVLKALKKGSATITVKDTKGKKYTCKVTVETPKINKTKLSLTVGKSSALKLSGNSQTIKWTSSNKKAAAVNSKGIVTAKAAGTTTITAKVGTVSFKCTITVKKAPTWKVTYNSNGGSSVKTQTVVRGQKTTRPSDPTLSGKIFVGWYSDANLTRTYDFSKRVKQNLTLYAKWETDQSSAAAYTRGEWISKLSEILDMNLANADAIDYYYADTEGTTYGTAIETAYTYGLLPPLTLTDELQDVPVFQPNEPATREFAAYTVAHALGYNETGTENAGWTDWSSITYKAEVYYLVSEDVMRLKNNAFCPQDSLSVNDVTLIQNAITRINQSSELPETTQDDSVYADTAVKEEFETVTNYTVRESSNGTYTAVVPANSSTTGSAAVGDTIVLPANSQHPNGIALKVTSIKTANNQITYTCKEPDLADVYSVIDFSGQATVEADKITAADGFTVSYDPNGTIESGTEYATLEYNDGISMAGTLGGSTSVPGKLTFTTNKLSKGDLKLEGSIEIQIPDVTCLLDADVSLFDGITVNEFTYSMTEKVKIEQKLTYTIAESGYELTNSAGNTRFLSGRVELGRVPLVITSAGISFDVILFLNYSAKGTISIGYTINATEGFQYKDGNFRVIKDFSGEMNGLEVKGSASVTLGAGAQICALEMFDLIGATLEYGPAVEATFKPHVLSEGMLYCGDISVYVTASAGLDKETVVGKFLSNLKHYKIDLQYQILKNDSNNPLRMNLHFENGKRVEPCTFGLGNLSGNVVSAKDDSIISGARVQVYDADDALITKAYTSSSGNYSVKDLEPGTYKISISANNYKRYDMEVTVEKNQTTYVETARMVPRTTDPGTVTGTIIDAVTGNGVSGASYVVRKNWDAASGDSVAEGVLSSSSYSLELETGNYTLSISKEGYTSNSVNITAQEGKISTKDVVLSPTNVDERVDAGNIRIVLTWGSAPRDLDSHLYGSNLGSDNYSFHTYYSDKNYRKNRVTIASLDHDDTSSYGPETTTIYSVADSGIYSYYVHDYTNKGYSSSTKLSSSSAKVVVYIDDVLRYTFNIPTGQGGTVWHVFDYNATTKEIIRVNTFGYSSNSGNVAVASLDEEQGIFQELFGNLPEKEYAENTENGEEIGFESEPGFGDSADENGTGTDETTTDGANPDETHSSDDLTNPDAALPSDNGTEEEFEFSADSLETEDEDSSENPDFALEEIELTFE